MRQSFSLSLKKYTFVLLFPATLFLGYLVPLLGVRGRAPAPVFGAENRTNSSQVEIQKSRKRQLAGSGEIA